MIAYAPSVTEYIEISESSLYKEVISLDDAAE